MDILDIAIAKQLAGGGGGSGTDNYNDLSNLPKINDTTLSGNKTSANLGLQSEINSDSKLVSDLVDDTNQDNKFVTSTEKNTWNAKQNAIDADHKLNADYVDDSTSTNKFVTASDKEAWNAKQNAIDNSHKLSSDLVDDANHTNKFVTSTEKQTWNAKQNAIDADHKLSSSLVSFSEAEAAAIASGIDSSKVGQISTNQSNILYACKRVGKNLFDITSPDSTRNTTVTPLDNGGATLSCSSAMWTQYYKTIPTEIGKEYKVVLYIDNIAGVGSNEFIVSFKRTNPEGSNYAEYENITTTGTHEATFTATVNTLCVAIFLNNSATSKTSSANVRIMICEKNIYDIVGSDYERFALPNYDLTRLQSEDRAGLVECVDGGAKNKLDYNAWKTVLVIGGTAVWENNGVTLTATNSDCYTVFNPATDSIPGSMKIPVKQGDVLVMSWDYEVAANVSGTAYIFPNGAASGNVNASITAKQLTYTVPSGVTYVTYRVGVSGTGNIAKWKNVMICTKAAFGVSQKFVPYVQPVVREAIDITEAITTTTGYSMLNSLSHLYKMGNNVFGELTFSKNNGNFSTEQSHVATINAQFAPKTQFISISGFSTSEWTIQNIGYTFIQSKNATAGEAGKVMVRDTVTTNNYVHLSVNYVT